MRILALDTSTATTSLAVVDGGVVVAEVGRRLVTGHATQLLGVIEHALALSGVTLARLDALAVGRGPGSFTGLRSGLATIRGLQLATDLPLWGVGSLRALATAVDTPGTLDLLCADGRRDELFAQGFAADVEWLPLMHDTPEAIGARAIEAAGDRPIAVWGDLQPAALARLTGTDRRFMARPRTLSPPIGRGVAMEVLSGRATLDDGTMEPLYVRPPDAKLPKTVQVAR